MRCATLLLAAVGFCGACGAASNEGRASTSSVATPTSLVTTSVSTPALPAISVTITAQAPPTNSSTSQRTLAGEADVVVAAAIHRLYGSTGVADTPMVDQVKVIERNGTSSENSYLEPVGRVIGEDVRAAVEQALAPSVVAWVGSSTDVTDELASVDDGTHQDVVWLLTFGEPVIEGRHATIVVDMLCGGTCGSGRTYALESSDAEGWAVTSTTDGWVA